MQHGKIYDSVTELIGNTPLVRLNRVVPEGIAEVVVKLESFNPLSSVKDRIAISMVEEAERAGELRPGSTLVEATSGNTGIGLAFVAAAKGYRCALFMPDSMSVERRKLLQALGADLFLTPAPLGIKEAQKRAGEYAERTPTVAQTMLSAIDVDPLDASTTTVPGRTSPDSMAWATMLVAIRSLVHPLGNRYSSLSHRVQPVRSSSKGTVGVSSWSCNSHEALSASTARLPATAS